MLRSWLIPPLNFKEAVETRLKPPLDEEPLLKRDWNLIGFQEAVETRLESHWMSRSLLKPPLDFMDFKEAVETPIGFHGFQGGC
jgi:hypothetical protein